jgi:hypothetical protein
MNLFINTTEIFEEDISKIKDNSYIIKRVNSFISKLELCSFDISHCNIEIHEILVHKDVKTKLYLYRLTKDYRVIFSIDFDNLFNAVIITFYAICKHETYKKYIKIIVNALKQELGVCDNGSK